jgi:Spy/CpxP family protein refolding chaperone
MKRTPQLKHFVSKMAFAIAAAMLLHSRPAALAQPNPEAPNRRQPPTGADRRGDRPQPGFQPGRALPMLERVLTEEQRESLHAAMESQRDQMRSLEGKIRAAHQALMKASLAEKFDEDAVRAKALEVGKLDAELAVLRAKAMSKLQPPLSEEQIERISNPPPLREMDGPGPGPRRNNRPPPGPRDLPVAPKPDPQ